MKVPAWVARHPALQALLDLAAEEARERGHELVEPHHLVLALTRQEGEAADLIRRAGAEPRRWRDYINYVLGLNDGERQAELGRVRPGHLRDVVEIRHLGPLALSDGVAALLDDALQIAAGDPVDHRHVLAAFFDGHGHIAAGTARFMRLSADSVRQAGQLPPRQPHVPPAEGKAVPPPGRRAGRLVLFGSCHLDQPSLEEILTPNERRAIDERSALLLDTAAPEPDPDLAASLSALLGFEVRDSFLRDRVDAFDARVVQRIGSAGAILLEGGSVLRLHSTLSASPALEALVAASDAGRLVIACSAGAQVLGHGCLAGSVPGPDERPVRLLGWLGGLIIYPHCSGPAARDLLRRTLLAFPGSAGLGLAHRGAVVLSPGWKEVEEVATGWDGGSLILASDKSRPRWLRAGRHRLPRAAARPRPGVKAEP